jgi:nucleoside-triphosphatase THEP1
MNIVITGEQGCGKTTVARKLLALMEEAEMDVGGIICPGYELIDVKSKESRQLLVPITECLDHHTKTRHYGIDESVFEFAEARIAKTTENTWTFFDEYGHLEIKKRGLHQALQRKVPTGRCIVLVKDLNLKKLFSAYPCKAKTYQPTLENRNNLPKHIFDEIQLVTGKDF